MFRFLVSLLLFHPSWVTDIEKSAISLAKSLMSYISWKGDSARGRHWWDIINISLRASKQLCWLNWCTLHLCSDLHPGKRCFNHSIPQSELQIRVAHDPSQSTQLSICPSVFLWGCHTRLYRTSPKRSFCSRILGDCLFWVTEARV